MPAVAFATHLHPQVALTSRPPEQIEFVGFSRNYFDAVRADLAVRLHDHPSLPPSEGDESLFERVHTRWYLDTLRAMADGRAVDERPRLSVECVGLEYCLPGYSYSLGGMCAAIDAMRAGQLERAYCFSLGGHHAHADWGHGYCLLNPLAATVRYAQGQGFRRVLIIDWDIHHGDGAQAIFARDHNVHCISIHSALDLYMAKASDLRVGTTTAAEAVGQRNIPLLHQRFPPDTAEKLGLTGRLYRAEESLGAVREALAELPWQPDLVCTFSGYDGHRDDCGKDITGWTNDDFVALTRMALDAAHGPDCPVLSVHGGGYKHQVTVAAAVSHVETLATYRPV